MKFLIASFTVKDLYGEGNAAGLLSLVVKQERFCNDSPSGVQCFPIKQVKFCKFVQAD